MPFGKAHHVIYHIDIRSQLTRLAQQSVAGRFLSFFRALWVLILCTCGANI